MKSWQIAILVGISTGLTIGSSTYVFGVYITDLENEFGWTRTEVNLALSVGFLSSGLTSPFVGAKMDSLGPRFVNVVSLLCFFLGFLSHLIVTNLWQFYLSYCLIFLGYSGGSILFSGRVISAWFVGRNRGRVMGFVTSANNLGGLIMANLAAIIIANTPNYDHRHGYHFTGWRRSSLCIAIFSLMIAVCNGLFIREPPPKPDAEEKQAKQQLEEKKEVEDEEGENQQQNDNDGVELKGCSSTNSNIINVKIEIENVVNTSNNHNDAVVIPFIDDNHHDEKEEEKEIASKKLLSSNPLNEQLSSSEITMAAPKVAFTSVAILSYKSETRKSSNSNSNSTDNNNNNNIITTHQIVHLEFKDLIKTWTFYLLLLAVMSAFSTYSAVLSQSVPFMISDGFSEILAAQAVTIIAVTGFFSKLVSGFVSEKITARWTFVVCLILQTLSLVIMISSNGSNFVWVGIVVYGFGFGGVGAMIPLTITEIVGLKIYGKVAGIVAFVNLVPGFLCPIVGGLLYDRYKSYDIWFTIVIFIFLFSLICFLLLTDQGINIRSRFGMK